MSKYFKINGYWKDDNTKFEGYIVKEYNDCGDNDDDVFFYGLSEKDIQAAIIDKGDDILDFVITDYKEIDYV